MISLNFVKSSVKLRLTSYYILTVSKDYINTKGIKMKTLKVLTIVAITGLVGATAVHAGPNCKKDDKQCQKRIENRSAMKEIFQQLDLTAEQQSALRENRQGMRAQMKEIRSKRQGKRGMAHMGAYVSAEGFDKQAFMDDAMKKAQSRIEKRAEGFEKTINILTPEQREKFATLLKEKQK